MPPELAPEMKSYAPTNKVGEALRVPIALGHELFTEANIKLEARAKAVQGALVVGQPELAAGISPEGWSGEFGKVAPGEALKLGDQGR
jgi:hypothetical protein